MKLKLKKHNDRYGYVDEEDNWVIEPTFLAAKEFENGVAIVRPKGLFGYLKEDGTWLVEPVLHYAFPFDGEMAIVQKGLFWGLINRSGQWVVNPTLIGVQDFENGICVVRASDRSWGYINNRGQWIIEPVDKDIELHGLKCAPDGLLRISKKNKYGFVDLQGNIVIPLRFDNLHDFNEGLAAAKDPETALWGYLDMTGSWQIAPQFDEAGDFKNGRAVVSILRDDELGKISRDTIIDQTGKILTDAIFKDIDIFNDPRFTLIKGETDDYGVIDRDGKVILEPAYDRILDKFDYATPEEGVLWFLEKKDKYGLASSNRVLITPKYSSLELGTEDLHIVEAKGKYGFVNRKGKEVLKPTYDRLKFFEDGLAKVKLDDKNGWIDRDFNLLGGRTFEDTRDFMPNGLALIKVDGLWGIIDKSGKIVAEPQFDEVSDFADGIARASVAGHWGTIDMEGNWLIEPEYDALLDFNEGVAPARIFVPKLRSARWGYINREGHWVIKPEFENALPFTDKSADVKADGKWGRIDTEGKWIIEPLFEEIERMSEGLSIASHDGRKGVVDDHGNWVCNPDFDSIKHWDDGFLKVTRDGMEGVVKTDGTIVIRPEYDEIDFSKDLYSTFMVTIKNRFGIIDREGNVLLDPVCSDWHYNATNNGYWTVKTKRKWGIVDMNSGKWIIDPIYEDYRLENSPALVWMKQDWKWGLLDLEGNWVEHPLLDDIAESRFSYNGIVRVKADGRTGLYDLLADKWVLEPGYESIEVYDDCFKVTLDGRSTWLGYDGKPLTGEWYDDVYEFHDGIALVKKNGKYGFIRKDGSWAVSPTYDGFDRFDRATGLARAWIIKGEDEKGNEIKNYGYVDRSGNLLGGRMFDHVYNFCEGLAKVNVGDFQGFIDSDGKLVIEPKFTYVSKFTNNIASATLDGKTYGYIDRSGEWKIAPQFEDAEEFSIDGKPSEYAVVKKDGKWGIIDMDGNVVVDFIYDRIGEAAMGIYVVKLDGKYGYITRKGTVVAEPIYKSAEKFGWGYGSYSEPLGKVTYEVSPGSWETKTAYITRKGEVRKNYKRR